ncbi:MAG TPA: glycosyltransferase family 39 protein [Gemmatimonadales bacterium]|nr:glycosyltransferase family 39 protein [Gemmatimonadales bacterium]
MLRLLAAVFSGGFLASDDHHVVIGAADQIASGAGLPVTYARSALLPGIIAAIMTVTRGIGVHDPGVELLIVRLLQGLYSLFVVYFVYRILEREVDRRWALVGGLLAAACYVMPVTAVHQLEESVCQVPLLAACWLWMRGKAIWGTLAGATFGIALILRFPLIGFMATFVGLALLQRVPFQQKLGLLGGLALVVVLQGFSNSLINHHWGYSFAERLGPMLHPQRLALEADGYPSRPPWHYVLTLLAALIPPASILLLAAAVKGSTRFPLIAMATLVFLVSHSLIANKQERFILPILPLLFVLIAAGLPWLAERIGGVYRGMWWYFWTVNAVLLVVVTFSFSKKDRVAPLLYIYRRHNAAGVLIAQYNETFGVPTYYLGKPAPLVIVLPRREDAQETARQVRTPESAINYVILYSDTPESDRAMLAQALHRQLAYVTTITPSLSDRLAQAINPRHNKAHTAIIYTTT